MQDDQQKRYPLKWGKASHRYKKQLKAEMPSSGRNYIETWLTDCAWYVKIQLPPPQYAYLGIKSESVYERTQGRSGTTDQAGPTEPEYVANGICGDARYRPTKDKPNGNRRRKIRPGSHLTF